VGYQVTAALRAAIELDFLTAIGRGASTPQALAARSGAAVRGARILANFLTIRGFLERHDGVCRLTRPPPRFSTGVRRSMSGRPSILRCVTPPSLLRVTSNLSRQDR